MLKNKESKMKILENFYGIDRIIFGRPVTEITTCCPVLVDEFVTTKGALLSVLMDMYNVVEYSPKPLKEKLSYKKLVENAEKSAVLAKERCKQIIVTEKGKSFIKKEVKRFLTESVDKDSTAQNINEVVDNTIRKALVSISLDNLLVANTILESKSYQSLNSWEGRILEDAYKTLKNDLIEIASTILEESKSKQKEPVKKATKKQDKKPAKKK
jgi:hypothetical protein